MRWVALLLVGLLAIAMIVWAERAEIPVSEMEAAPPRLEGVSPTAAVSVAPPSSAEAPVAPPTPVPVTPPARPSERWVTLAVSSPEGRPVPNVLLKGELRDGGEAWLRGVTSFDGTLKVKAPTGHWKVVGSGPGSLRTEKELEIRDEDDQSFTLVGDVARVVTVEVVDTRGETVDVVPSYRHDANDNLFVQVDTPEWFSSEKVVPTDGWLKLVAHRRGKLKLAVRAPGGVTVERCQVRVKTSLGIISSQKLELNVPYGPIEVTVTACFRGELWVARAEHVFSRSGETLLLELRRFEGIPGRVVDEKGAPIEGAQVIALLPTGRIPRPHLQNEERALMSKRLEPSDLGAISDAKGNFVLRGRLPPLDVDTFPAWRVFVMAPGLREPPHEIWAGPDSPPLQLTLVSIGR